MGVDLAPLVGVALEHVVPALATLVAGWLVALGRRVVRIEHEARARATLADAIERGFALAAAGWEPEGTRVTTGDPTVDRVLTYVVEGVPDALRALGASDSGGQPRDALVSRVRAEREARRFSGRPARS